MPQFPQHRISNSDNIRTGNAVSPNRDRYGVPLAGAEAQAALVVSLGSPAVEDPDGLIESFTTAGASAAVAMDGAIADANTGADGEVTLDVPRNIVVDSGGADDAVVTVTGRDVYGQRMVETITMNSTTAVEGKKAFKKIISIGVSKAVANGGFIGTAKKLGLPYRPVPGGFIRGRAGEDTSDAGTYVAPERSASTATTADVRGTYAPAATLNGSTEITVVIAVKNGPTDADAYGIAQYAG